MGDSLLKGVNISDKIPQFAESVKKFITDCMAFFFNNL